MRLCKGIEGYILTSQTENKSAHTLKIIKWDLDIFAKWLLGSSFDETSEASDVELELITTEKIREFIEHEQHRDISPHTVHQEYRVLRAFLRWCLREEILSKDPTSKIRPPHLPNLLPKALEPEQIRALLRQLQKNRTLIGRRDELMIHTLLGTGLRASELLSLNVSSVFPESSYILVEQGKGRKDRVVPLEPLLNKELWKYVNGWRIKMTRGNADALFVGRTGRRICIHGLAVICRKPLKAIGAKGSIHIFRHTFASIFLRNGGNIETLRRIMGHQSTEMTIRYVSLLPNDLVKHQMQVSPLESVMH